MTSEPVHAAPPDEFRSEMVRALDAARTELGSRTASGDPELLRSWDGARALVERFQPVPWVIWKLVRCTFGHDGRTHPLREGLVLGLRKLLFAAAADRVAGSGDPPRNLREALVAVPGDVFAAAALVHGVSRRLSTLANPRLWGPILDDALLRAHVGFFVGQVSTDLGPGRGMLAGFSGRVGLAVLLATGSEDEGESALRLLAGGADIADVTTDVYGCDALHVAALLLAAAGCGRDAAFGVLASLRGGPATASSADTRSPAEARFPADTRSPAEARFAAAATVADAVRTGRSAEVDVGLWTTLSFALPGDRDELEDLARIVIRRGHGWEWMKAA